MVEACTHRYEEFVSSVGKKGFGRFAPSALLIFFWRAKTVELPIVGKTIKIVAGFKPSDQQVLNLLNDETLDLLTDGAHNLLTEWDLYLSTDGALNPLTDGDLNLLILNQEELPIIFSNPFVFSCFGVGMSCEHPLAAIGIVGRLVARTVLPGHGRFLTLITPTNKMDTFRVLPVASTEGPKAPET